jgi:NAD(P)-dependent dehydrogenase (short-subunit alcohol dehydrogenase family)
VISAHDGQPMNDVVVVLGPGQIGQAMLRRVGMGGHSACLHAGRECRRRRLRARQCRRRVSTATVDISQRPAVESLVVKAMSLGNVTRLIRAAACHQAKCSAGDLEGRPLRHGHWAQAFGDVVAAGESGVVIASQPAHRLPALSVHHHQALAMTPVEELLSLPFLASKH